MVRNNDLNAIQNLSLFYIPDFLCLLFLFSLSAAWLLWHGRKHGHQDPRGFMSYSFYR